MELLFLCLSCRRSNKWPPVNLYRSRIAGAFWEAYRDEIGPQEIFTEAAGEPVQMPGAYLAAGVQTTFSWVLCRFACEASLLLFVLSSPS